MSWGLWHDAVNIQVQYQCFEGPSYISLQGSQRRVSCLWGLIALCGLPWRLPMLLWNVGNKLPFNVVSCSISLIFISNAVLTSNHTNICKLKYESERNENLPGATKIETVLCAAEGTASQQHGLEACAVCSCRHRKSAAWVRSMCCVQL